MYRKGFFKRDLHQGEATLREHLLVWVSSIQMPCNARLSRGDAKRDPSVATLVSCLIEFAL